MLEEDVWNHHSSFNIEFSNYCKTANICVQEIFANFVRFAKISCTQIFPSGTVVYNLEICENFMQAYCQWVKFANFLFYSTSLAKSETFARQTWVPIRLWYNTIFILHLKKVWKMPCQNTNLSYKTCQCSHTMKTMVKYWLPHHGLSFILVMFSGRLFFKNYTDRFWPFLDILPSCDTQ